MYDIRFYFSSVFGSKLLFTSFRFSAPKYINLLLVIGFIEEMRTKWGNKEVPQTFVHSSVIRENTI